MGEREVRKCVYIRKLVISNVQMIKNIPIYVFAKLVVVDDLTLPSDLFNRTVVSLQGVSVTPDAFETIALKYSDTLNELCLIGALVHTPDAASYFQSLSRFKVISTLSLPPSLYSLSAEPAIREFNVVHLLPIRYLSIFVYQPEIVECRFLLRKLVPETLTKLCLHDASGVLVKHFASKEFQGLHFEVKFCRRGEILLEKDWMMGYCDLLSHMVWSPPYKHYLTDYPSQVNFVGREDSQERGRQTPRPSQLLNMNQLPAPIGDPGDMMVATLARMF
uniref:DUF663 domain-containing protein n=1 Tax=Ascaris lumbricoides TaxID=6252 RepID=A0A0M3IGI1_ASCLU